MKLYKLTDEHGQTLGKTQWGPGITHCGTGRGDLCSSGWIHAYEHPLLAVIFNPIHGGFISPLLWEAEGEIALRAGQTKCGCKCLTTLREIPLPVVSREQRVKFAITCALAICPTPEFKEWARSWFAGDRSWHKARQTLCFVWHTKLAPPILAQTCAARSACSPYTESAAWAARAAETTVDAALTGWEVGASIAELNLIALAERIHNE